MIDLDSISVSLPPGRSDAAVILNNITLHIARGEWIAVGGRNGSGKTTLLKTIAGLVQPSQGEVRCSPGEKPRIALLFQEPDNQFVASTTRDELLLSMPPGARADDPRVDEALKRFSLHGMEARNPHRLSGGEKQRLALATVWLFGPDLLLLDEPTAYLDDGGRKTCVDFVRAMNEGGVAVVWATPDATDGDFAGRRVVIRDGALVESAPVHESTRDDTHGVAVPSRDAPADGVAVPSRIAPADRGTGLRDPAREGSGSVVAALSDVAFNYGDGEVLKDINLTIARGECVGVAGRNGAGKSTLLGILSGLQRPTRGSARLFHDRPVSRGRQNIFYVFQNPERLFFAETVEEEIAFGLKSLGVGRNEIPVRITKALDNVDLDPNEMMSRLPMSLSLGEMRRLAFAIAASLEPDLLLFDEPTSCLDADGCRVFERLVETRRREGRTSVIASHDRHLLARTAGRIFEL